MALIIPSLIRNVAYLETEQLLGIPFWLKPWLKSNSFGSNFFHLPKSLATTYYEPGSLQHVARKELIKDRSRFLEWKKKTSLMPIICLEINSAIELRLLLPLQPLRI